jgi:hypothetical protein
MSNEPTANHTDRSTRLLILGILFILGGGLCLLIVPLMLWAMNASPPEQVHRGSIMPIIGVYSGLGIAGIALGIGSIRCRRWARDLILSLGSFGLTAGVPGCIAAIFMVGKTMKASMAQSGTEISEGALTAIVILMSIFYSFIFIGLPLAIVLLYRGKNVLQTCIARSGPGGWTSHLTIPQIVCTLICFLLFVNTLLLPLYMPAVMIWDFIITGPPAIAILITFAALTGYATWGLYYQTAAAWWLGLISIIVICLNYGIAFYVGDIAEFYRAMNFSAEQITLIQDSGVIASMRYLWISSLAYILIALGFFLRARPE